MNSKVAKYSNILYTLSNKNNLLDKVSSQMALIKHLYKKEPNFRLLFETKRINSETKQNIIRQIFKGFEIVVIEFSCIIIQQKDSLHLINIINKFIILANKKLYANKIEIIVAKPLDEDITQSLIKELNHSIKVTVDPSMIGGIKLRKGNKIFDNSISCQLNNLKKTLYNF